MVLSSEYSPTLDSWKIADLGCVHHSFVLISEINRIKQHSLHRHALSINSVNNSNCVCYGGNRTSSVSHTGSKGCHVAKDLERQHIPNYHYKNLEMKRQIMGSCLDNSNHTAK